MIEGLIAEIYRAENPPVGIEETRKAIFDREALGGTRFPTGIAIPHARFDGYEDLLIAVAVPSSPVPDSPVPIRMMVLMLTSKTGTTLYLNTLGAFLKISRTNSCTGVCAMPHPGQTSSRRLGRRILKSRRNSRSRMSCPRPSRR
jgi:hypothetical protein